MSEQPEPSAGDQVMIVGPDGKPVAALVTNAGAIRADGGVVQLTAAAADGVVSTLVQAGGRIRADTADGRTGRIEITGTGGSVIVAGSPDAAGLPLLADRTMIGGQPTAYVCRHFVCKLPVTTLADLEAQLAGD